MIIEIDGVQTSDVQVAKVTFQKCDELPFDFSLVFGADHSIKAEAEMDGEMLDLTPLIGSLNIIEMFKNREGASANATGGF